MGLTAMTLNSVEAEREELAWLLSSGVLGRSNNLARMLTFICEKHFEGREDQIKEHTIAVEALGRRPDFDPHVDTIVRVTAHSLRKRLLEVYQNEGANRPMHIVIPAGNYVPSFVPQASSEPVPPTEFPLPEPEPVALATPLPEIPPKPTTRRGYKNSWALAALLLHTTAFSGNPRDKKIISPSASFFLCVLQRTVLRRVAA